MMMVGQRTNHHRSTTKSSDDLHSKRHPSRSLSRDAGLHLMLAGTLVLFAIVASIVATVVTGQASDNSNVLRVGFAADTFPDLDQRDVKAAMQLWTKQMAKSMGLTAEPRTTVFNRTEDLLAAVNRGELTIVSLPALEYLRIRKVTAMRPAIVSHSNASSKRRFILVARRDSSIRTVRDLRGKRLVLPSKRKFSAGHIWLDVLLLKEGLPDAGTFCRDTRESPVASQALMTVFFKQSDVAVVNRGALETSIALNPQLGRELTIIAESDTLLGDLSCFPDNVSAGMRRSIEQAATHLHESTTGRQIFTLFQMDRAIPFQPAHLVGLEELLRDRDRLLMQKRRKP
jgi:ABC-type phosphate/phosphonate transport system substrate-binding protein